MQLDVRGHNLEVTVALRDHVTKRLRFALGRVATRLERVAVRIADVNGPRGGVDKRCRVRVVLPGRSITIVPAAPPSGRWRGSGRPDPTPKRSEEERP